VLLFCLSIVSDQIEQFVNQLVQLQSGIRLLIMMERLEYRLAGILELLEFTVDTGGTQIIGKLVADF